MARVLSAFLGLLLVVSAFATRFDCSLEKPDRQQQDRLIWSFVDGFLSAHEIERLDAKLTTFARETSNQLIVVVVDTLCGLPEGDLATELGHKWGLGQKDKDNGVVVLIKPNGPPGERVVYIAVGYGLEPVIPDLMAKRIVRDQIIPAFQQGRYFEGLDRATDSLMALAKGEYNEAVRDKGNPIAVLIFMLLVFGLFISIWFSSVRRYAKVNNVDLWTAMWLMSQAMQRHDRSRGGGFGGFGGGGGFSGGGGFGGFGGGGFGGGGAGGRW